MSINDIESFIYSPPPWAINDLRYENLRSEGYYGSLNDMLYQKFRQKALNLVFDRLFINGEQGINKLDFSDFTGMYQDRARTVPYTAVEQPLGSFTGLNGVPAIAPADVNRGVVSARVNLLTKTEDFSDAVWAKYSGTTVSGRRIISGTGSGYQGIHLSNSVAVGVIYITKCKVKAAEYTCVTISDGAFSSFAVTFNLTTGAVTETIGTGFVSAAILDSGAGEFEISVRSTFAQSTYHARFSGNPGNTALAAGAYFTGDGVSGVEVWDVGVTLATDAHLPYQRVNTATDYDTAGFPHYLAFNGTNTTYTTPSIDFTGTDKMTVWAGLTKLSDAAAALLLEHSANWNVNNGVFLVAAPGYSNNFELGSKGTSEVVSYRTGFQAPINANLSMSANIGGPSFVSRINGVSSSVSTSSQGTGNYGNYPLYIGARNNTSLYFNGRLYSLIVRGAATALPQIEAVETLIRQKMRLP